MYRCTRGRERGRSSRVGVHTCTRAHVRYKPADLAPTLAPADKADLPIDYGGAHLPIYPVGRKQHASVPVRDNGKAGKPDFMQSMSTGRRRGLIRLYDVFFALPIPRAPISLTLLLPPASSPPSAGPCARAHRWFHPRRGPQHRNAAEKRVKKRTTRSARRVNYFGNDSRLFRISPPSFFRMTMLPSRNSSAR